MNIIFFETDEKAKKSYQKIFNTSDTVTFFPQALTEETISNDYRQAEVISIFIHSHITKKVIDAFVNLKLIITRSTGYDHIDMQYAQQKGILVETAPIYASESVAEHTFALILMLSKKMKQSCCSLHMFSYTPSDLQGFELAGKTLGIIGFGNIGKKVARIAAGFEMNIIIHDDTQKELYRNHYTFLDLKTVLQQADIVTFHVPLTDATFHLLNKDTIQYLKKGSYVINTSRGEVIASTALWSALQSGLIAGAGLDVLEEEYCTQDPLAYISVHQPSAERYATVFYNYALIQHPKVIVTCHNAYNTQEAMQRVVQQTQNILEAFKKGETLCKKI